MTVPRSIIFTISVFLALLWLNLANEGLFALSEKGTVDTGVNHALVIGISDYAQWEKLKSPSKDAAEIAKILTEKYDFKKKNVVLLNDASKDKPTTANILTYISKYVSELSEKDNLLIFYSGHSAEDDKGETYWIPEDAKKKLKMTWLKHSDLCNEFLASKDFKAKSLSIITDSLFSKKLLKPTSIVLSPFDLRYREKITEKAQRGSREVIAFGDRHWPGSKKTEGFGLFTYYIRKALKGNWFKVIDIENLIFDEEIPFQIRKIAGTKLLRGRLRNTPSEKGGQSVITRMISPPVINIKDTYVSPKKGFVGDKFIIEAETSGPAYEVYVEVGGKKYLMDGTGTEWKHTLKMASLGSSPFKVVAINEDDKEGKSKKGLINTIKPLANMVSVASVQVSPKKGIGGDEFSFTASTDNPAAKVQLDIEGERYDMTGSGTKWSLKKKIEASGTLAFSVISLNENNVEGRSKGGLIVVKAPKIGIAEVKSSPEKGFAGDVFQILARTDFPASAVSLRMDGVTYAMEGEGKEWRLKRKIPEVGKKSFTVIAKNADSIVGPSKTGTILTSKRPLGIPDITTVALSPEKVHAGESFVVKVKTSAAAQEVYIELEGKKQPMDGSGTDWKYSTQIASVGTSSYKVTALNKDGQQGRARDGKITTMEKVAKGIDVVKAEVNPKKGNLGQSFTFKATTSAAAQGVAVVIGEKRYKMTGSGANWSLKRKIEDLGSIDFYMIASDKKGVEGSSRGGTFVTKALLANVATVKVSSDKGYAGEEFLITAGTDQPASSVSLEMDGVTYEMAGSGKEWSFKKKISDVGKKGFIVSALNVEGTKGQSKSGEIVTTLAIPDVTTVAFNPEEIFAGDSFLIRVKTNAAADKVFVELGGKKLAMEGSGTEWKYMTQIASIGTSSYKIEAINSAGKKGKAKEGKITSAKKPGALVNVAKAEVEPGKGFAGGKFTFKANTDIPAKGVTLTIGGKSYEMTGSGKDWTLTREIDKTGSLVFSMAAINEDDMEGGAKTHSFTVEALTKRYAYNKDGTITDKISGAVKKRFLDNGDGTITDLATNLMWVTSPKRIAVDYADADDYCRNLKIKDFAGWRLPTISEWRDILDKSQQNPALPPGHLFSNIITQFPFWSKSKYKNRSLYVYKVNLYTGQTAGLSKKKQAIAWPVRYAETAE